MTRLRSVNIGSLGAVVTGRTPPGAEPGLFGNSFPFITPTDVDGASRFVQPARLLSEQGAERLSRMALPPRAVCVVCIGATIGKVCMTRERSFTNQQINSVVVDGTRANPTFLFHLLRTKQAEFRARAGGAATPILNKSAFSEVEIALPPIDYQNGAGRLLAAYDDLIDNCERRIRLLDEAVRVLYGRTVVGLRDPAHHIPLDPSPYWRFISENVAEYDGTKRYFATADVDGLTIQGSGIEYAFNDRPARAQKQPVVWSVWFARMKETFKILWYTAAAAEKADASIVSSGFAGFEATDPETFPFLFATIASQRFHEQRDRFATGATQMALTNDGLKRIRVPVPLESVIRQFGRVALPSLMLMQRLQDEVAVTRRLRDLLVPRLLRGEIDGVVLR